MAISSVSSYSPMFDYQGWVDKANSQANALGESVGYKPTESTSSTDKTSGSSSTSSTNKTSGSSYSNSSAATSASSFLLNYKKSLTDLESASRKGQRVLQVRECCFSIIKSTD